MKIVEPKPFNHDFVVSEDNTMPKVMQVFENVEAFHEFFSTQLISERVGVYAERYYTEEEIYDFRENILDIVENQTKEAEEAILEAERQLQEAKDHKARMVENSNALQNQMKDYRDEINKGKTEIELKADKVYRVPHGDNYYYYTLLSNGSAVLAKIQEMTDSEKNDLFSSSALSKNKKTIESILNGENQRKTK